MHHFQYQKDELYCEEVPVSEIARNVGTPFYLYSHATLRQHFRAFDGAFGDLRHLTCFSMKSNSNLAILRLFAGEGGGVDIVSGGELHRALKAGMDPLKSKRDYGNDLVLEGGMSALLWDKPDAIEAEIRRLVPGMMDAGGYIFGSDHSIPSNVSLKDYQRIVALAKEVGRYG